MFSFSKGERLALVAVSLLVVGLICLVSAGKANAQFEANRPALAYAGGGVRLMSVTASSHRDLPKGYTIWSGDGASFWITPFSASGTLESVPIKVPENTPITITAPKGWASSGTWYQMAYINATSVTDSVYALPLDK